MSNNIKIGIKIRPLNEREKKAKKEEKWKVTRNSIQSLNNRHPINFHFDHIFGPESHNSDVYSTIIDPIVKLSLNGFNGTIFAYGPTSSGKTHTMMGTDEDPGIVFWSISKLFERTNICRDREFVVRVSFIEIYKEKVYDLLNDRKVVNVDQHGETGVQMSNKEVLINSSGTIAGILYHGNKQRRSLSTDKNESSSRSHAIFRIVINSVNKATGDVIINYLNLVDLAGGEPSSDARTSESRLKEAGHINNSLMWFSSVINGLNEGAEFIKYGNSILTQILEPSLKANAKIGIICSITLAAADETLTTLKFAMKVQNPAEFKKTILCVDPQDVDFGITPLNLSSLSTSIRTAVQNSPAEVKFSNSQSIKPCIIGMKRDLKVDEEPLEKRLKREKSMSDHSLSTTSYDEGESRSFSHTFEDSEKLALEHQLRDMANIKADNLRLTSELDLMKSAHENEKKWHDDQIKAAKLAQEKAEFQHTESQIIFTDFQTKTERRIEELLYCDESNKAKIQRLNSQMEKLQNCIKIYADSLKKQKDSLRRLENENLILKQKTKSQAAAAGIQNKIKNLEDTVSKEIQILKKDLQNQNLETVSWTTPRMASTPSDDALNRPDTKLFRQMTIPNALIGCIIGTGGSILKNITLTSGATLEVSPRDGSIERTVSITGKEQSVALALDLVNTNIKRMKDARRRKPNVTKMSKSELNMIN